MHPVVTPYYVSVIVLACSACNRNTLEKCEFWGKVNKIRPLLNTTVLTHDLTTFVSINENRVNVAVLPMIPLLNTAIYSKLMAVRSLHGSTICGRASIWQKYEWKLMKTVPYGSTMVQFFLLKTSDLATGEYIFEWLTVQRVNIQLQLNCLKKVKHF